MAKPEDSISLYILLCFASNRTVLRRSKALSKSHQRIYEPCLLRLIRMVEWATDCFRSHRRRRHSLKPMRDFEGRHARAFRAFNSALRDGLNDPDYERFVPLKFHEKPASLWCKAGTLALAVVVFCAAERIRLRRRAPRDVFPAPSAFDRTLASRYRHSLFRGLIESELS